MSASSDIIAIAISILIAILLIGGFVMYLSRRLKQGVYSVKEQKAILESMRDIIEKQIYTLNDRMIQNEERWKDVNHLLLGKEYLENKFPGSEKRQIHYSEFLKANGISENDLIIDERLIFILTPFNEKYYEEYRAIKDVCEKTGFRCVRGDESYFESDIFPEMLKLITKSRLIIANINGRSPNVLYELGIAQAIDKPVLLVSMVPENLPIDIKSKRFFIYKNLTELQDFLRSELLNLQK